jgi:NAD(P)-dependent dehydrogenase (short-subunit alcohol dehydrogenase family)
MKKFVITGAGQGIGFELVKQLLGQGHFVIWNEIDSHVFDQASKSLNKLGLHQFVGILGDAASEDFLQELTLVLDSSPGVLTGVVCNAGITTFGDFWTYSKSSMDQILRVNLVGTFFLIQLVARYLKDHNLPGSIVVMSSVTGHQAHPDLAAYGMTKAALNQLVQNLVIDLSPYQIRINAISPGATITERTIQNQEYQSDWAEITPLGKAADVADIAASTLFFLSDQAKHITGQTLVIDGGWTSVSPAPKH